MVEKSGLEYLEKYTNDPNAKAFCSWLRFYLRLPFDQNLYRTSTSDCKKANNPDRSYKTIKPINESDYAGWQKIETYNFSFYIPLELVGGSVRCIEGGCYSFTAGSYSLHVDINYDAARPSFERAYSSYCEKGYVIDSFTAWIWFYQPEDQAEGSPYRYESGALFRSRLDRNLVFNISLFSRDANINELADKIFSSVKYKKADQKTATQPDGKL